MTTRPPAEIGMSLDEVDTPALIVDLDAFESNLRRLAERVKGSGVRLRPHAKTHKCPVIALKQMELGAVGVCCQKVSEAEAMVYGGVKDVLVTNEVVGRQKLRRLMGLAGSARIGICADDPAQIADLEAAAKEASITLPVYVEINMGGNRCGVEPGEPAAELAARVAALPGLRFEGLQGYEGNLQHVRDPAERRQRCLTSMERLIASRRAVESRGLPIRIVSTAGTGTHAIAGEIDGVTEVTIFTDPDLAEGIG